MLSGKKNEKTLRKVARTGYGKTLGKVARTGNGKKFGKVARTVNTKTIGKVAKDREKNDDWKGCPDR